MRNLVLSLCMIAPATLAFAQQANFKGNVTSTTIPLVDRLEGFPMRFPPEIVNSTEQYPAKFPSCFVPHPVGQVCVENRDRSAGKESLLQSQAILKSLRFVPPMRNSAPVLPSFQFSAPKCK